MDPQASQRSSGVGVTAASVVALSFGGPVVVSSLFSIVLLALSQSLHEGRAVVSSLLTVMTVFTAIGSPLIGRLADRFGPRPVILSIVPIFGAALIGMGFMSRLGFMYVLMAPLGVTATVLVPVYQCLSGWFDRRRATAMAVAIGVSALVAAALVPAEAWLLSRYGWRGCFIGFGLAVLVVSWPVLGLWFRSPPSYDRAPEHANAAPDIPGATLSEASRTAVFWALMLAMVLMQFVQSAFRVHAVALVHDRGLHLAAGVAALVTVQVATMIGRLAEGWALDRFASPKVAAPFTLLGLGGLVMVQLAQTAGPIWLGSAMIGVSSGGEIVALSYFLSRYFGLRAFGQIYGVNYFAGAIGIGLGPLVFGLIFDRVGDYGAGLATLEVMLGAVLLILMTLPRYSYGAAGSRKPSASTAPAT